MNLKQKTASGLKWSTLSTVIVNILSIGKLAIIARILEPSDFGLMAIAMVVIGFSKVFIDVGISNAIIYKQEITHTQLSSLYWVNIIAGVILFGIIVIVAPLVGLFYNEPKVINIIFLVGTTFLIQPFGQQFTMLLRKELRFKEIARIDIITNIIGLITTVWFAYKGYGVYALVYGMIIAVIVKTVQYMMIGFKEYRPSIEIRINEIKEFLNFGAYQMGERTINYFNSQLDVILIGKIFGIETLGIYNLSKQLIMRPADIFNPIITKVTFPVMAKVQNDIKRLKKIYLKTINYLSSINFPIYAFLIVFAHDIVLVMYGNKWLAAVPIVQILSIWGALRSTGNPIGSLLYAKGKANWGFWWNLALLFYFPIGIYVGSHWGLVGVSWALVFLLFPFIMLANWFFLVRNLCDARFIEYHVEILKPASISVFVGLVVYMGTIFSTNFIIVGLFGGLIVIGLNILFNKVFIKDMLEIIK